MEAKLSTRKKILFWFILLLLVTVCLEVFSYFLLYSVIPTRLRSRTAFRSAGDYIAAYRKNAEQRSDQSGGDTGTGLPGGNGKLRMFHPVLGWDYPPGASYSDRQGTKYHHGVRGERRTCTFFPTDLVATYGDSFTYCADVEDCQTWQTFLGETIGANVLNFGVAGYGTDQAFLKYELNEAGIAAPIAILGILPDDVNRVVNVWRTFYAWDDPLALTKPCYVNRGNSVELLPNPLTVPEDVKKLHDPVFVGSLGQDDYWFRQNTNRPALGFPYLWSLICRRTQVWEHIVFRTGVSSKHPRHKYYPDNLLEEDEPLRIMCHIVDRFVQTARSRNQTPVTVIMAHKDLVAELRKHKVSRVRRLAAFLKERGYLFLDLIEAVAASNANEKQLNTWFRHHATAEGNRVIAGIIADYLEKERLIQTLSRQGIVPMRDLQPAGDVRWGRP